MQQSQEMQAVHQQLQETLQTLHRKAVDADQILDSLQRDQKGSLQPFSQMTVGLAHQQNALVHMFKR